MKNRNNPKRLRPSLLPLLVLLPMLWATSGIAGISANPTKIVVLPGTSGTSVLTTTTPDDPRTAAESIGQAGPSYTWTITDADGAVPCSIAGSGTSVTLTAGRTTAGLSKVKVQVVIHWTCAPGTGSVKDVTYRITVPVYAIELTTKTVATAATNLDGTRKTIGVAEEVTLTVVPTGAGSVAWTVANGGTFSSATMNPTKFTAPESASGPVVTATCAGLTLTATFTVIEPVAAVATGSHAGPKTFQAGKQGVAMTVDVQITPTNVSFYRVKIHELGCPATNRTGSFAPGQNHVYTPTAHKPLQPVQLSQSNMVPNGDAAWFGGYGSSPWVEGSYTWDIPMEWWAMTGTKAKRPFAQNNTQVMTITATDGTSTVTKFGQTGTRAP